MPNIIITGASKGIGRTTASYFAKQGWTVWAAATTKSKLDELAKDSPAIRPVICDVTKKSDVQKLFAMAEEQGSIDAVLHCAGKGFKPDVPMEDTADQTWQEAIDVNIWGSNNVTIATKQVFVRQERGVFVGIGSRASLNHDVLGGRMPYSATKHAQLAIYETLLRELPTNAAIRVFGVCPGFVPGTDMVEDWSERHKDELEPDAGTPVEVVAELLFGLVSQPEKYPYWNYVLDDHKLKAHRPAVVDE